LAPLYGFRPGRYFFVPIGLDIIGFFLPSMLAFGCVIPFFLVVLVKGRPLASEIILGGLLGEVLVFLGSCFMVLNGAEKYMSLSLSILFGNIILLFTLACLSLASIFIVLKYFFVEKKSFSFAFPNKRVLFVSVLLGLAGPILIAQCVNIVTHLEIEIPSTNDGLSKKTIHWGYFMAEIPKDITVKSISFAGSFSFPEGDINLQEDGPQASEKVHPKNLRKYFDKKMAKGFGESIEGFSVPATLFYNSPSTSGGTLFLYLEYPEHILQFTSRANFCVQDDNSRVSEGICGQSGRKERFLSAVRCVMDRYKWVGEELVPVGQGWRTQFGLVKFSDESNKDGCLFSVDPRRVSLSMNSPGGAQVIINPHKTPMPMTQKKWDFVQTLADKLFTLVLGNNTSNVEKIIRFSGNKNHVLATFSAADDPFGLSWYYNIQSIGDNDKFFDKNFEAFRVSGRFNYNSPVFGLSGFDVIVTNRGLKPLASQEALAIWTTVMDSVRFNWPERSALPK
jgi:hypothetical protein